MLFLFQTIFVLFALAAIIGVVQKHRQGVLNRGGVIFWIIFWCAAAIVVVWPRSTQIIAGYLGIGRGTDVVLYSAVALIFYLLFRLQVKIEGINRDVTKVVRGKALEEMKERN